jgi:hypothetical protein
VKREEREGRQERSIQGGSTRKEEEGIERRLFLSEAMRRCESGEREVVWVLVQYLKLCLCVSYTCGTRVGAVVGGLKLK